MQRASARSVSILITTYNHESFVASAIESVLSQRLDGAEVIVVDDGSSDGTHAVARRYEGPALTVVKKPNGGPASALNLAVALSSGEVLVLFSGDDLLPPSSIETRLDLLMTSQSQIVACLPRLIDRAGGLMDRPAHPFLAPVAPTSDAVFNQLFFFGNFICAPSVMMTRQAWQRVGQMSEALWQLQDYEYWLRAAAKGLRFAFMTEPMVQYRLHGKNLSTSHPERLAQEMLEVLSAAPQWLSRRSLQALLFGTGLARLDIDCPDQGLHPLLLIAHSNAAVRAIGEQQLRALLRRADLVAPLRRSLALAPTFGGR